MNKIVVGNTVKHKYIWIGFSEEIVEHVETCISGHTLTAYTISREDAEWLIGALRKELYGEPEDDVEDWIAEDYSERGT